MGKIIIIEEKAEKMSNKLEKVKRYIEDIMECFEECRNDKGMEDDEEDWDEEPRQYRKRMNRRTSRY